MYGSMNKKKTPGGNLPLCLWLLPVVLVTAVVVGLFVWAWKYQADYRDFVADFSNSTYHAYHQNSLRIEKDGKTYSIRQDNVYPIYAGITARGSGRVGKPPEKTPDAVLTYGDGAVMQLWEVALEKGNMGLFISFVDPEGERYSYDAEMQLQVLPIEDYENTPKVKDLPVQ